MIRFRSHSQMSLSQTHLVGFFVKPMLYKIKTSVPPIIINAPNAVFMVNGSPKKATDNIIAIATLILSTGATWDTFHNCNALK